MIEKRDNNVPKIIKEIEDEVSKLIVGQKEIVRGIIAAILCDGHILLEGVPGIAKTLMIKTISEVMGCEIKRVQFTVDLLPTDITGIMSYEPRKGFEILKGPVFTNFLIADEINRAPPKTQGSLLEAMQEKNVSIAKKTYPLPKPFFVMATENPLENSGVYTLPEAQVDRFLFKLIMKYPQYGEEIKILGQNVSLAKFEDFKFRKILSPEKIIELQKKVKEVFSSDEIKSYIVKLVNQTRDKNFEYAKYISYGASPRASISLFIASKAEALMHGRKYVIPDDVKNIAYNVLRHRIILNYEAEAEKITSDEIIKHLLDKVRAP